MSGRATANLRLATRWAAWSGQAIAWLLISAGLLMVFGVWIPFLGTGWLGGLWLAFIGWFLHRAARQSYRQVVLQEVLAGVPLGRLMRSPVPTVPAALSVSTLVHEYMMGTDERAFPVLADGDQFIGLVCLVDVRQVPREAWDTTPVRAIMTPSDRLTLVTPPEEASAALGALAGGEVTQVPVVQDGRLVGLLRRRDVLTWLHLHTDQAA